ncbi:unnamed protein product [Pelagomonas calceolata]|uniref:HMG box domain-containing protein n=2 Tax=Pelagomonas calceolata TaxID=35677 RepID=A0A8J2SK50_9STRA|nr:unnamed protein product [Pelagomonas calceolata]
MDEPPRAVTAAAARAARESPGEGPEAAGAGRAMREEEERAAHWGERRAARERDRSASPPPPAGHASSYKQFKFRAGAKQYAEDEASLGANGYPGIVKAADWPGWRLRRQAVAPDQLPPAEELDRTAAPDAYDRRHGPPDAWEGVADAELDRARTPTPPVVLDAVPPPIPNDGSFLATMKRRFAAARAEPAAPIANDGSFLDTMKRRFAAARGEAPAAPPPPPAPAADEDASDAAEPAGDAVPEVTVRSSSESDGSGRPPPKKRKRRAASPPPGAAVSAPPSPPDAPAPAPAPARPRSRDPSPGRRFMRPSELFAQDNRAAVRAEHPGDLERAVRNRLSEMWRSADAATRERYVDRAKTLRERARSASRDGDDGDAAAPAPAPAAPPPRAPKHAPAGGLGSPFDQASDISNGGRIAVGAAVEAAPHAFGANFVKRVGTEARYRGTVVERGADDVVDGLRNSLTDRVWRVRYDDDGLIWATPERFLSANGWVTVRLDVAVRLSRGVKRERGFRGNELRPVDDDDEDPPAAAPAAGDVESDVYDAAEARRTAEELAVLEAEDLGRDVLRPPQPDAPPRRVAAGDGTASYGVGERVQVLHFKGKPTGAVVSLRTPGYDVRLDHSGIVWPLSPAVLVPGAPDTPPRRPSPPSSPEPSPDYRVRRTLPTGRAPPPPPPVYRSTAPRSPASWVPERVEEIAWSDAGEAVFSPGPGRKRSISFGDEGRLDVDLICVPVGVERPRPPCKACEGRHVAHTCGKARGKRGRKKKN